MMEQRKLKPPHRMGVACDDTLPDLIVRLFHGASGCNWTPHVPLIVEAFLWLILNQ